MRRSAWLGCGVVVAIGASDASKGPFAVPSLGSEKRARSLCFWDETGRAWVTEHRNQRDAALLPVLRQQQAKDEAMRRKRTRVGDSRCALLGLRGGAVTSDQYHARMQILITRSMRKVLVEELDYLHEEVDEMDPQIAAVVIEKSLPRPRTGMPAAWKKTAKPRKSATPNPIAAVFGAVQGGTQAALHAALAVLTFPLRIAGAVKGRGAKGAATVIAIAVVMFLVVKRETDAFSGASSSVGAWGAKLSKLNDLLPSTGNRSDSKNKAGKGAGKDWGGKKPSRTKEDRPKRNNVGAKHARNSRWFGGGGEGGGADSAVAAETRTQDKRVSRTRVNRTEHDKVEQGNRNLKSSPSGEQMFAGKRGQGEGVAGTGRPRSSGRSRPSRAAVDMFGDDFDDADGHDHDAMADNLDGVLYSDDGGDGEEGAALEDDGFEGGAKKWAPKKTNVATTKRNTSGKPSAAGGVGVTRGHGDASEESASGGGALAGRGTSSSRRQFLGMTSPVDDGGDSEDVEAEVVLTTPPRKRHASKRRAGEASREEAIAVAGAGGGASQQADKDNDDIRLAKTKGDRLGKSSASPAGDSGEADEECPGVPVNSNANDAVWFEDLPPVPPAPCTVGVLDDDDVGDERKLENLRWGQRPLAEHIPSEDEMDEWESKMEQSDTWLDRAINKILGSFFGREE